MKENIIYDLPDLTEEIKKIWSSPKKWRMNNSKVEFSLDSSYGDQWFNYWQAPIHVERFVNAYLKLTNTNENSDAR